MIHFVRLRGGWSPLLEALDYDEALLEALSELENDALE